ALAGLEGLAPGSQRPNARAVTTRLALAMQGALLCRFSAPEVADAFCASRLGDDALPGFGTAEFPRAHVDLLIHRFRYR
ncbi:MAG: putative acyl-CoA dehydrogenase, partial [Actinomycetota bacterium]|nr:putative acyl-CoA dehydrogenase [Actinomycetota bacterium]